MTQKVDYKNIRDALVTILETANTTTASYDLSNGLGTRIKTVSGRDLNITPLMHTEFPYVSVRLDSKLEDFQAIGGNTSPRGVTLSANIYCIYDNGTPATAEDDLWDMVANVDTVLRANITLGDYLTAGASVQWVLPEAVSFVDNFGPDSPYNKSARIDATISLDVKDI